MTVRPIAHTDVSSIVRATVAAWRAAYRGILSDALLDGLDAEQLEAVWHQIVDQTDRTNLVIDREGQAIGFVGFGASRDQGLDPAEAAEIYGIYVHPEQQHTGAGSALMEAALDQLSSQGYRLVVLWTMRDNTLAHRFYQKNGFRPDGATKVSERQEERFEEVRFRKEIR